MKGWMFLAAVAIVGCLMAGCGEKSPKQYISKRSEYTFEYPGGWRVMDDERRLTAVRQDINSSGQSPMSFEFNPDAVLVGDESLGALVVVSPLPLFASGVASDSEEDLLDVFRSATVAMGLLSTESTSRVIHGKTFRIDVVPAAQDAVSLSALCLHNNHVYMFQWSSTAAEFPTWRPVFEKCLDSVSFAQEDIESARQMQESARAGFFTGLWHGALLPFRALASIFWRIDLYADSAGRPYLVGFIVGMLWWAPSILGGRRRA